MADTTKEQKLALARKKLKEYQKKKAEAKNKSETKQVQEETNIEHFGGKDQILESFGSSDVPSIPLLQNNIELIPDSDHSQLRDYFSKNVYTYDNPELSASSLRVEDSAHENNPPISNIFDRLSNVKISKNDVTEPEVTKNGDNEESLSRKDSPTDKASSEEKFQIINDTEADLISIKSQMSSANDISNPNSQDEMQNQTISIMIAEKAELLSQLQVSCSELDRCRLAIAEMESKYSVVQSNNIKYEDSVKFLSSELTGSNETVNRLQREVSSLTSRIEKYRRQMEELQVTNDELNEKVTSASAQNETLSKALEESKSKYELASIHLKQLKDYSNEEITGKLQSLQMAYDEAQNQIIQLSTSLAHFQQEKSSVEEEYKRYGNELVIQLEEAKKKILEKEENEISLQNQIAEFNEQLNELRQQIQVPSDVRANIEEIERLKSSLEHVIAENGLISQQLTALQSDNTSLSKLCNEQRESIEKLEIAVESRKSQEVNTSHLLEKMESDQVAAKRALSQNKQLKEQLEELQNGFILMSNKKLELTEKLEIESHFRKRLEKEMKELQSIIDQQREMASKKVVKTSETQISEQIQRDSPEVQSESKAHLEAEPKEIPCDPNQNHQTESKDAELPPEQVPAPFESTDNVNKNESESIVSVGNSESESVPVANSESEVAKNESELLVSVEKDQDKTPSNSHNISAEIVSKNIHAALEERFMKCMKDLAETLDHKQRLEHVVERLSLETEAVGDYITIYQFQRGVMRKQMEELHCELDLLKTEKEDMRNKVTTLQNLIAKLTKGKDPNSIVDITENGTREKVEEKEGKTVQQIVDLVKDMENTSHTDYTVLNKFHPCPLCSGKLINV